MQPVFKTILKCFALLGFLAISLLSIAVLRALTMHKTEIPNACHIQEDYYLSDDAGLSKRLSKALQFRTISFSAHNYNRQEMANFIAYIQDSFPVIHSSPLVTREVVNNLSLLYHIKGRNKSLKPYLLAGHMDVVPAEESHWSVPPFSGEIKDGFIWGRGSMDCKDVVMGSLEALEFLLQKGYHPERSFYLAYGHDEEVNGEDGAKKINELLTSRNVQLEYLLDEGSVLLDGLVPGLNSPVALISVTEKGMLSLEVNVTMSPGHASMPPKETAIVVLAKALSKLEGDVLPSMFGKGTENTMMQELAYCGSFPVKVFLGNMWLFKPIIMWNFINPVISAIHRTTVAVTVVSGGTKINMLPNSASAMVNLRVHPAQTIEEVIAYLNKVINDERVKLNIHYQFPSHPISPTDSFGYAAIKKSIKEIYNDSCIAPATLVANTDTRWYLNLTHSVYRFSAIRINPEITKSIHGHDEKLSINNYVRVVNFFIHLIKNSDETQVEPQHSHSEL